MLTVGEKRNYLPGRLVCPEETSDGSLSGQRGDNKRVDKKDARNLGVDSRPNESLLSRQVATGAYLWDKAGKAGRRAGGQFGRCESRGLEAPGTTT